jgi:disulfide bond formation protein DsbB
MITLPSFRRNPNTAAALLAALCACLVAGSFFVEYVLLVEPCPLCIVQRYTYATLAPLFLAAALLGGKPRRQRALLLGAMALVLIGGGVAAYQSKLQLFPAAQAATCSASLSYMLDTLPVADVVARLFQAHGDCSDTSFKIVGLTLAQISLVVFTIFFAWLAPILKRAARAPRPVTAAPLARNTLQSRRAPGVRHA